MPSTVVAVDRDTGTQLTPDESEEAAANPLIYTWVEWRDQ